jgi:hypothetical protein
VDKGWVLNQARDRWELLGADGEPTGYGVSRRYLAVYGTAGMNRQLAGRGLPPLDPASPWWHLIMVGGPLDGLHDWADPAACDGPPERLTVAWADPLVPPDALATLTRASVYRRAGRGCGHRGCPVAYVEAGD